MINFFGFTPVWTFSFESIVYAIIIGFILDFATSIIAYLICKYIKKSENLKNTEWSYHWYDIYKNGDRSEKNS